MLDDEAVVVEEVDDSKRGIDPTGHVLPVGLVLLLLDFDGIGDEKHGVFTKTGADSGSNRASGWFSVCCLKTGHENGSTGKESSTNCDTHSSPAISSSGTDSSLVKRNQKKNCLNSSYYHHLLLFLLARK